MPSACPRTSLRSPYDLDMPPSSRHGRQPTFTKPIAAVFWLVALGVVAVAVLAEQRLAMQLAIAGAWSASLMIWSVYDAALREARKESSHERALHARSVGAAADEARAYAREVAALRGRITELQRQLVEAKASGPVTSPEAAAMWDLSDAPTVVDMANRREGRPIAIVKRGDHRGKRAAETA